MASLLGNAVNTPLADVIVLGINHEEQHQELLYTDIKYILGHNPLFPPYSIDRTIEHHINNRYAPTFITVPEGLYKIGYHEDGFCFDNELGYHRVFLEQYAIATQLVTNGEYLEFMEAGGYQDHRWWHADGLAWVRDNKVSAPLYWHNIDGKWNCYSLEGLQALNLEAELCHVSFYEAAAYAAWRGMRLPTEFEWEVAATGLNWGSRWEWTNSAYLPYPGFVKAAGAIGEYNGKFMVNQMVLRGASVATTPGHSRMSYRNFFHPHLRWQYTGIRLAR
jgi:ergothioneine biosynthesis protein EgtB